MRFEPDGSTSRRSVCGLLVAVSLLLFLVAWSPRQIIIRNANDCDNNPQPAGCVAQPNCTPTVGVTLTQSSIQSALNGASAGSTICLPSGTGNITSTISVTVAANVTLMGQTVCTGAAQTMACTDGTILENNTGGGKLFSILPSTTGTYRQSGLTYHSTTCSDNPLNVEGTSDTYRTVRFDHSHWYNYCNFNFVFANARGVADHNLYENPTGPSGANQNRAFGVDDDTEWTHATNLGSQDFNWFYMEDSKWDRGIFNDCYSSGRQVFRYNYMNNGGVQEHGTGHSGQNRGCRAIEVYNNTILDGAANTTTAIAIYTGSGVAFNNAVTFSSGTFMQLTETRQSNYTYDPGAMPSKWGPCGTSYNGTASVWDGNTDATGYPCLDQVGRGAGDLLSSDFSTKRNNTRGCTVNFTWANRAANCDASDASANPRQALEPVYEWLNTGTAGGGWVSVYRSPASAANIVQNRDFYLGHSNTNCNAGAGSCTAGVGSGTLGQIPSNCTAGVSYWATDTNGLYKCVSTNVWSWYYSPLTYPHPVIGSLPVNNYSTNFPNVENPISERSVWTGGQDAGGNEWGNMQVGSANFAYGVTEPTSFGDPTAILKGTWGATQAATALVKINTTAGNLNTSGSREAEVRLRSTISAGSITGYECYCSAKPTDPYCHIASWGGPNGQFVNMDDGTNHGDGTNSNPYAYTVVGHGWRHGSRAGGGWRHARLHGIRDRACDHQVVHQWCVANDGL